MLNCTPNAKVKLKQIASTEIFLILFRGICEEKVKIYINNCIKKQSKDYNSESSTLITLGFFVLKNSIDISNKKNLSLAVSVFSCLQSIGRYFSMRIK